MMINVSGCYNPYADERKINSEAYFELIDVDAHQHATVIGSTQAAISEINQTFDKVLFMTKKIATLEPNEWQLNSTYKLVSNSGDNAEIGYWSEAISDAQGNIDITLAFDFDTPQNSKAITVIFDDATNNYATDFTIQISGEGVFTPVIVTDNTQYMCEVVVNALSYTKLELNFTKTNKPHRRIRVSEVVFGSLKKFTSNDISMVSIQTQATLDSSALPSGQIRLTIDNSDRAYNIINPNGVYRYLQEGQGISSYITINGEKLPLGYFYFQTSESDDNSMNVTITGYDKMYTFNDVIINIGGTGLWTVAEAVVAVLAEAGYSVKLNMPDEISARIIGKQFPENVSVREALRLIAQAARCACFFDCMGRLQFIEFNADEEVDYLNNDNMAQYPKITDTGLINSVVVTGAGKQIYTASNIAAGEDERVLNIENPLVISRDVAAWLLDIAKYRIEYSISDRGNPARGLFDVVKISDIYGENRNGVLLSQTITVSQGMTGTAKVVARYE